MSTGTTPAAVWRDGVLRSLVAYSEAQPRDETGKWTSDGSDQSGAQNDEEAKQLYAALLALPPGERDKFLAGLNNDQLTRLAAFAGTGKATDGPIADIRNRAGQAMAGRGLDPSRAGLKSTGGKKKAAKKGGSKGKSSGGGGGSKGGGSKKSSGGGGGGSKKSSGGGSSKKKTATKKPAPKPEPKPAPKPKPAPPPPQVSPVRRPSRPRPPGRPSTGPSTQPVRSSAGSMAEWNRECYQARRGSSR